MIRCGQTEHPISWPHYWFRDGHVTQVKLMNVTFDFCRSYGRRGVVSLLGLHAEIHLELLVDF